MTKIDIFSGFLGAGKTTLIKKLIKEAYKGEKLVLIENEFGEIGVDGGFLKDAGVEINEMNSGCICCSLVGDFSKALKQVIDDYSPDRVLIEPSGVGKLSDVIKAVENAGDIGAKLGAFTTVADVTKVKMYAKNFGEFYIDQIESAGTVILSRTKGISQEKIDKAVSIIREHNEKAQIITTDWDELDGAQILHAMENTNALEDELHEMHEQTHHHHHEHDNDEHCCCGHHDHEHEHGHEHCHHEHEEHHHEHHHEHDEHCECGCHDHEHEHHHEHDHDHEHSHHEHEHHHEHDEHCECGSHDHDHEHHHHDGECSCGHHHHHADEVFDSYGKETSHKFTKQQLSDILAAFEDEKKYGFVLRAKGIVEDAEGGWIHFDYVPGCPDIRNGSAEVTGRICVIGSKIDKDEIAILFGV